MNSEIDQSTVLSKPLGSKSNMYKHKKAQLIDLVTKIMLVQGTEGEINLWVTIFERNVPHPAGYGLIFYPTEYGLPENASAEEIVEKALSYKPTML